MKKLIKKFKKNLKNAGSTLILVIVALGFVGILTGALLTAVGYAYRQKLYDYNAKSNFYYLEQAMDEIYAGLGAQTMGSMQDAYEYTRENVIEYDITSHEYKSIENEEANKIFKNDFMKRIANGDAYKIAHVNPMDVSSAIDPDNGLIGALRGFITNEEVELDWDDISVIYVYTDGSPKTSTVYTTGRDLAKVQIKNITLQRSVNYNRSTAKGQFMQRISTDIEISRPDFDVNFDGDSTRINNLFEFCIVSDSGVEVNKTPGSILSLDGNIYAANDFYNKKYNDYAGDNPSSYSDAVTWTKADGTSTPYVMNKVTKNQFGSIDTTDLLNMNDFRQHTSTNNKPFLYDGNNLRSKYSGFYVNGSSVNVFANKMIVPGSIAVMNAGTLNVYGIDGTTVTQSNVWADEIVLAGDTQGNPVTTNGNITSLTNEVGSRADFTANLYVKDDTQIESDYSRFRLNGKYFGYGNSTKKDTRTFIPTTLVDSANGRNIYQEQDSDSSSTTGNMIRSHYNSSAFIVNGQHSNINLLDTTSIYIAGRSYIELSKIKSGASTNSFITVKKEDNSTIGEKITNTEFTYDSNIKDYKTGESLSIKSSQLAYKPDKAPALEYYKAGTNGFYTVKVDESEATTLSGTTRTLNPGYKIYYYSELPADLKDMYLFTKYFNTASDSLGGKVPVIYIEDEYTKADGTKGKKSYYYLDFQCAYDNELYSNLKFTKGTPGAGQTKISSADDLSQAFITDYFNYVTYIDQWDSIRMLPRPIDDNAVLDNKNNITISGVDYKRTDTLAAVTKYDDYKAGAIATPNANVYSSGAVTTSVDKNNQLMGKVSLKNALTSDDDVSFIIQTNTDQEITSTLLGADETTANPNKVNSSATALTFSEDYEKHYNYMKWSLQDLTTATSSIAGAQTESQFVDNLVNAKGADSLTPLNNYFNFDKIVLRDPDNSNQPTKVEPQNLKLSPVTTGGSYKYSEYKVWVSYDDVHVTCENALENNTITGIIITKGDVYFDEYTNSSDSYKTVKNFNGIIVSGGKVYINNTITNINSSDLCKTIMNQCMVKAKDVTSTDTTKKSQALAAVKVLETFKEYEEVGKHYRDIYNDPSLADLEEAAQYKNITNIDYSDVIRYNNWMRNVEE